MFARDKRNGRNGVAAISTLIAEGTTIRGELAFAGGLHLDGEVEGAVTAEAADAVLTLSDKGRVTGDVRVSNAVVNGTVKGNVTVRERLELADHARIEGDVCYKILEMAAGARVDGRMFYQDSERRQLTGPQDSAPTEA